MRETVNDLDCSIRLDGPEVGHSHEETERAVVGIDAAAPSCRRFILTAPLRRATYQMTFYIQHDESDDQ